METGSSNSKKIFVAGLLAVLAIFAGYYVFSQEPEVAPAFDEFGNPIESQVIGKDLIELSQQLETVTLDATTLKKKSFTSLVDYSVLLPSDGTGRPNPFARVGNDSFTALVNSILQSL